MNQIFQQFILQATQAKSVEPVTKIQSLWSGYGNITRYRVKGGVTDYVVVKHVQIPTSTTNHPRGWNTNLSHQRKLRSYDVEMAWYQNWSLNCNSYCRVPTCFATQKQENEIIIVLEDLEHSGFPKTTRYVSGQEFDTCIKWLANFHATHFRQKPEGLWPMGSYWHLATRPDEWQKMEDIPLKNIAHYIDKKLNSAHYQTIIHGDAKMPNFCFSSDRQTTAAVDFQYVGAGCGMKDVINLMRGCLDEHELEQREEEILKSYFQELKLAFQRQKKEVNFSALELEWRTLFPFAWADFRRFLNGWNPSYYNPKGYGAKIVDRIIQDIS